MMRTVNLQTMPLTGIMPDHKPIGYGRRAKKGDDNHLGMGECADCRDCDCFCDAYPDDCW